MRILNVIFVLLLASCGGSENAGSTSNMDTGESTREAVSNSGSGIAEHAPCDLLTESMVRAYLHPGDIELKPEPGTTNRSSYCQYQWYFEPSAEEQQEMMDRRTSWTTARMEAIQNGQPEPPAPVMPNRTSSVFFNVMNPFESVQEASDSFDLMVQRLSEGMTIQTKSLGDIEIHGGEMILIDGIGDKAVWDPGDSQISVLKGRQLFHLKIRLAFDEDASSATAQMATDLVSNF